MDFAGGTAVHITSGTTVAAVAVFYTLETKGYRHCLRQFWYVLKERVMSIFCCCNSSQKDHDSAREGDEEHEMVAPPGERGVNGSIVTTGTQDRETATDPPASSLETEDDGPHNVNNVVLGTALLWIGWFGFNGGSALGGNLRAVSACTSTHVAACAGGSANLIIFWFQNSMAKRYPAKGHDPATYRKPSIILFCDGVVIALVAITPAAGYVRLRRKLANRDLLTEPGSCLELPNFRSGILHLYPLGKKGGRGFLEG
jgi:ammonia channel protein AmtB